MIRDNLEIPYAVDRGRRMIETEQISLLGKTVRVIGDIELNWNNLREDILNTLISIRNLSEGYLNVKLKNIPSFTHIPNIEKAVERLLVAKQKNEPVLLYGDYDVDGITSTTIVRHFLEHNGFNVKTYIPNRDSGYGLSKEAIDQIANVSKLVITLDNGTNAVDEIRYGEEKHGIEFFVLDHHRVNEESALDTNASILNPYLDNENVLQGLCTAGLSFYFVGALRSAINPKFDIKQYLDLVAIATIADMMPIHYVNRVLTMKGIEIINRVKECSIEENEQIGKAGLKALLDTSINQRYFQTRPITYKDIGFSIAPKINSVGRMESAVTALKLFHTKEYSDALKIAEFINEINTKRKIVSEQVYQEALTQVLEMPDDNFIVIHNDNWHHGVVGIVAGKLARRLKKPVAVFQTNGEYSVGSIRSDGSTNVYEIVSKLSHMLERWGGHSFAVGVKVKSNLLDEFRKEVNELMSTSSFKLEQVIDVDMHLPISWVTSFWKPDQWFLDIIYQLSPYGELNPEPKFISDKCIVLWVEKKPNIAKIRAIEEGREVFLTCFDKEIYENINSGDVVQFIYTADYSGITAVDAVKF